MRYARAEWGVRDNMTSWQSAPGHVREGEGNSDRNSVVMMTEMWVVAAHGAQSQFQGKKFMRCDCFRHCDIVTSGVCEGVTQREARLGATLIHSCMTSKCCIGLQTISNNV